MPEEDRWSDSKKILDVECSHETSLGTRAQKADRPAGERDWEDKAVEAQLPPPPAGSGHARRVYLKHGDFIEHGLSESCPGWTAMKLWAQGAGPLPSVLG